MIGEREDFNSSTQYGALRMRSYNIDGNAIDAFYDLSENLIFVLDNTINAQKPNVLLVINPNGDKKWDEILGGDYGVDLETIRPKVDNKYQKFDIEYSGLAVYDALIRAFDSGDSLEDALNQLTILRDSAARHSAMSRLNTANEIITKTNATIVKTKESIVRLNARLKTLRAKVAEAKKGIGREPTKQSAAKILKLESQIDATNEKIKRANERLKSAQRRLETATVDAELAGQLLNQPGGEMKQVAKRVVKPVAVRPVTPVVRMESDDEEEPITETTEITTTKKETDDNVREYSEETTETTEETTEIEDVDENVKPLFNEDPQILNNDIAFKPIDFGAAANTEKNNGENVPDLSREMLLTTTEEETTAEEPRDEVAEPTKDLEEPTEIETTKEIVDESVADEKPVLDSMLPVPMENEPVAKEEENKSEPEQLAETEPFNIPEFSPIAEPVADVPETVAEKPLNLTSVNGGEMRQYEPEYVPETYDAEPESKIDEPIMPRSPVMPQPPIMPQAPMGMVHDADTEIKRKPSFMYYLLLIVLIVLAIFTLWYYQRNVDPTTPVVTSNIERVETDNTNGVLKKQPGARKPFKIKIEDKKREELNMPTFLDTKPAPAPVVEPDTEEIEVVVKPTPKPAVEEEVEVEVINKEPEIMDAVPARVNSSGNPDEAQKKVLSEEEILAAKPAFQPGSKYDEMFVAEEDGMVGDSLVEYVDEEPQYMPDDDAELMEYEYTIDDDVENPLYDAEEMEYQAEYNAGMFTE